MDPNFIAKMLINSLIAGGIEEELAIKIIETARNLDKVPERACKLTLLSCNSNKIGVIKIIRAFTGLGLKEAKAAAETPGWKYVLASKTEADDIANQFKTIGAEVTVSYV